MKKRKKLKITLIATLSVLVVLIGACFIYLGDYYRPDEEVIDAYLPVKEEYYANGNLILKPENANFGLIFYPGGKVDEEAYIPLMREISSHGVVCVLIKMPFRLALFDINAADGVCELFPEISDWYIAGHSLGGSMAASYLEDNHENFKGLMLLGSYSTADLSTTSLKVLSVYGSLDGVMRRDKYEAALSNMPENFCELIIEGGNHAYFGSYGEQSGDGIATITNAEQIKMTANAFMAFISG